MLGTPRGDRRREEKTGQARRRVKAKQSVFPRRNIKTRTPTKKNRSSRPGEGLTEKERLNVSEKKAGDPG